MRTRDAVGILLMIFLAIPAAVTYAMLCDRYFTWLMERLGL